LIRSYRVEARSLAPIEAVWPLLGQAARWPEWSFLDRAVLERTGRDDPDGVGAIRHFTRFGTGSREEVLAWEPPGHLAYSILSGFPVKNYRSDIWLRQGACTFITWSGTFEAKVPGTGRILETALRLLMGRFARNVARYAEASRT
jgi:hypothetical protein